MTTDLQYLAYVAMLTAALWIPYVSSQIATNGMPKPVNYVDPTPRPVPLWGKRADRTYLNAVESFAPFAALILIAAVTHKSNGMTAFWAQWFFWARLAHAVVYLLGVPYARTICFLLGFAAVVGVFWELIR